MPDFSRIIGKSPAILDIFNLIERVCRNREVSVLIGGETGTGKEVVAKTIHENSSVGNELFVEVNCAAIPEHLLESELFGCEKGAYTGADRRRRGLFELADGGLVEKLADAVARRLPSSRRRAHKLGPLRKIGDAFIVGGTPAPPPQFS